MNFNLSTPLLLVVSVTLLVLSGAVTLAWTKRSARYKDWTLIFFMAVLLGVIIFAANGLFEETTRLREWTRGWIWPLDQEGAIAAGILEDPMGLALSGLSVLFGGLLILSTRLLPPRATNSNSQKLFSAIAFSTAGCVLSWISITPWLALVGVSLATLGGFLALGSEWNIEEESSLAIRFVRERAFGIVLSIFGACALTGGKAALFWTKKPWISAQGMNVAELAGAILLITGLLIHLQPFPLQASVATRSRTSTWVRVSLTQVFPAWTVFALLIRLQAALNAPLLFEIFGWILVVSCLLSTLMGVLQPSKNLTTGAWVSSGLGLSAFALCMGEPEAALSLLIGIGLGSAAFSQALSVFDSDKNTSEQNASASAGNAIWSKTVAILGLCAASGVITFVSSGGALSWLAHVWSDPIKLAATLSAFGLYAMLAFKLVWSVGRGKIPGTVVWSANVVPSAFVLLALGIFWTGEFSGGVIPGAPDKVFTSFMELFFGTSARPGDEGPAVLGAYFGVMVFAVLAGYWAALKIREPKSEGFSKKLYETIIAGYGADYVFARAIFGSTWVMTRIDNFADKKVWNRGLPMALSVSVRSVSNVILKGDQLISLRGRGLVRRLVDTPAKFLQLIQNGDVQWYLFFGIGSGFLVLAHYLFSAGVAR